MCRGKTKFATIKRYNLHLQIIQSHLQIIQSQTCYPLIFILFQNRIMVCEEYEMADIISFIIL